MAQPDFNKEEIQRPRAGPDARLLLDRLGRMVAGGEDEAACRAALSSKAAWQGLDTKGLLAWARLAQAAGVPDTALDVLEHVNRTSPELTEAWEERVQLLEVLGREKEMSRVVAEAGEALKESGWRSGVEAIPGQRGDPGEADLAAVVAPFETRNRQAAVQARFLELFAGREDCFARQWADRGEARQGYVPVRRPMTGEDLAEHLRGTKTYGIYLLRSDATVATAVIDMDLASRFRAGKISSEDRLRIRREALWVIGRLREIGREKGLSPLVEFSGGKGFHFWFFFDPPVEARRVRRSIERLVAEVRGDVTSFGFEVFPKQDALTGKGLGNLVKLPLGIHRLSGKRSRFTDCAEKGLEAQLAFLNGVQPIGPDGLRKAEEGAVQGKVVVHPRMREWAGAHPELAVLERKCPPLGQIIVACREGRGLGVREEKILYQVVGFLGRAKTLMHELRASDPEYNPHLVDYTLSRVRGKPLGCKRIHRLLQYEGDYCPFDGSVEYAHPLLHVKEWDADGDRKAEKAENLGSALENLKLAISQVQRFMR